MSRQSKVGSERKHAKTIAHAATHKARGHVSNDLLTASSAAPNQLTRQRVIAETAYYRSEKHGFTPGHELEDWLAAEKEINEQPAQ